MSVNFLAAVFVRVKNLEKSISFYSEVLGLKLRDIEQWDNGRGANYIVGEDSPLLTLIETNEEICKHRYPNFNLYCHNLLEMYEGFKNHGYEVGEINHWSSGMNVHTDFDIFDPDGNAINLIEWQSRTV
jgi:lactoylglutathione lyase